MADIRGFVGNRTAVRQSVQDGAVIGIRTSRDGSPITLPWVQALVFEGRVFGINAGSVTTPVAGHTGIDADQPEMAVRIPDGTDALPLYACITIETGSTTLGVGGAMIAVSNIDVGAGTSTSATPFNLHIGNPRASAATCAITYSGNGTDPLTAGNFHEIMRQSFALDSDAATSGFAIPRLEWSAARHQNAPVIVDAGTLLAYVEHAANAPSYYGTLQWAEFTEGDIS